MIRPVRSRLLATIGAAVTVFALTAGSASAHFCYFTEANVKAELGRAGSNGFMTFGALAYDFTELCPAGIDVLAAAGGVTATTTIHARAVMAGGAESKGKQIKPISHLNFGAIEAAIESGAAAAACAP